MTLINNSHLDQKQWGNWLYNHPTLTLQFKPEGRWLYEIDLEDRCHTASQMLDWIFQLHAKTFISDKDMRDLLRAFHELCGRNPQAILCRSGNPSSKGTKVSFTRKGEPSGYQ